MGFPTLDRLGVRNFAGVQPVTTAAEFELFRKQYSVELIKWFNTKIVFANRLMKRQIPNGTGCEFPLTGKTGAKYFIPGVTPRLTGSQGLKQTNKTINLDRPLISDISVSNFDELMKSVDVQSERAEQQTLALVEKFDKNLAQLLILCSRASTIVPGKPTGGKIYIANIATDPDVLVTAITRAVGKLAANDVPIDPSTVTTVLPTAQYFGLLEADSCMTVDYTSIPGTAPFRTGKVPMVAGVPIDYSNNIPSTNITEAEAGVDPLNVYHGDFSASLGVVFHKSCVGTVQLLDITMESEYSVAEQATLLLAKMMVGSGYLRPEAAVELSSAS